MVRKGILCIKIFKWSDIIFITNIYTYKLTKYTAKKTINKNEKYRMILDKSLTLNFKCETALL